MANPTCFVIQPFEEPFNKRYTDIYEPAITAAGLTAYRVDRDPSVDDIVKRIQEGIREAAICLADISLDNPNVFYELGAAHARGIEVVMLCDRQKRTGKFPFDVSGRAILTYSPDSTSDFDKLRTSITERIGAVLKKGQSLQRINHQPLPQVDGLESYDVAMLVLTAEGDEPAALYSLSNDMEKAGYTRVAAKLGMERLLGLGFVKKLELEGRDGSYLGYEVSSVGMDWLRQNTDKIKLRRDPKSSSDEPPF